jgi:hypothetical protein
MRGSSAFARGDRHGVPLRDSCVAQRSELPLKIEQCKRALPVSTSSGYCTVAPIVMPVCAGTMAWLEPSHK